MWGYTFIIVSCMGNIFCAVSFSPFKPRNIATLFEIIIHASSNMIDCIAKSVKSSNSGRPVCEECDDYSDVMPLPCKCLVQAKELQSCIIYFHTDSVTCINIIRSGECDMTIQGNYQSSEKTSQPHSPRPQVTSNFMQGTLSKRINRR